jgi:hypothetical protein
MFRARPHHRRVRARLLTATLSAVLLATLTLAGAPVAAAEPTAAQVEAQRAEAQRLAALADVEAGRTEAARVALVELAGAASVALETFTLAGAAARDAQVRADQARAQADEARAAATAARARESVARAKLTRAVRETVEANTELGRYAAAAYREGASVSGVGAASSLLASGDITDFGRRVETMRWVGVQQARALERLRAAEAAHARATAEAARAARAATASEAIAVANEAAANAAEARAVAAAEAAAAAKAHADKVVADQQSLIAALEAAAARAEGESVRAERELARLTAARAIALERQARSETQRRADIAAGRVVIPLGDCTGGRNLSRFDNGDIPHAALCPLWGAGSHVLRADAAAAFNELSKAYAARFGSPICVTDSYRSYEMQVNLVGRKPRLAATPGTSNHGWGRAVDLCDGVNNFGTTTHEWMRANAPRYGWFHPAWAGQGRTRAEPWHWEFAA